MRGAVVQGLAVGLAGTPDLCLDDRGERDELDGVYLDQTEADPLPGRYEVVLISADSTDTIKRPLRTTSARIRTTSIR